MAPVANDNMTAHDDLQAAIDDPLRHYPWLSSGTAAEAHGIIMRAILGHLGGDSENVAGLAAWVLEELAAAGLKIVRRP